MANATLVTVGWFADRTMKNNNWYKKVTFPIEQATKAQRGSTGIALLFL
jgi:hypothetical protein